MSENGTKGCEDHPKSGVVGTFLVEAKGLLLACNECGQGLTFYKKEEVPNEAP